MLDNLTNRELRDTTEGISKKKRAAYQENILEDLCMDIFSRKKSVKKSQKKLQEKTV